MAAPLASDELRSLVAPLLPPHRPRPKGGRRPAPDRACLTGILFVLKTGIQWEWLPQKMGCGSGMTCWRWLRDWHAAGVWDALQQTILAWLQGADRLDWSRAVIDASLVPAKVGGKTGRNPTDRGKRGSKRHLVTDRQGIRLAQVLTAANVNEGTVAKQVIDAVSAIRGKVGRPRRRPEKFITPGAFAIPAPHMHHVHREYDAAVHRLLAHWGWERTELQPGGEM
jgi:transposase